MVIFINFIKIAHPAHVARGKACAVREICLQKLCDRDCRALLWTLTDDFADGIDLNHLRKILRENRGQFPVHRTVIHRFSDVHGFPFLHFIKAFRLFFLCLHQTPRILFPLCYLEKKCLYNCCGQVLALL